VREGDIHGISAWKKVIWRMTANVSPAPAYRSRHIAQQNDAAERGGSNRMAVAAAWR